MGELTVAKELRVGRSRARANTRVGRATPWRNTPGSRAALERTVSPEVKKAVEDSIRKNGDALRELEKH